MKIMILLKLKDRDAWVEMQKIVGDPVIGKIFMDDEENFLDRPALRIFPCEEIVGANE